MTDEGPDLGLFAADADATPLTPEEREGLIPSYIALRSGLNAAEQRTSRNRMPAYLAAGSHLRPISW